MEQPCQFFTPTGNGDCSWEWLVAWSLSVRDNILLGVKISIIQGLSWLSKHLHSVAGVYSPISYCSLQHGRKRTSVFFSISSLSGGEKFVSVIGVRWCETEMRLFKFLFYKLSSISTLFYLREMSQTFFKKLMLFSKVAFGSKFAIPGMKG